MQKLEAATVERAGDMKLRLSVHECVGQHGDSARAREIAGQIIAKIIGEVAEKMEGAAGSRALPGHRPSAGT